MMEYKNIKGLFDQEKAKTEMERLNLNNNIVEKDILNELAIKTLN